MGVAVGEQSVVPGTTTHVAVAVGVAVQPGTPVAFGLQLKVAVGVAVTVAVDAQTLVPVAGTQVAVGLGVGVQPGCPFTPRQSGVTDGVGVQFDTPAEFMHDRVGVAVGRLVGVLVAVGVGVPMSVGWQ